MWKITWENFPHVKLKLAYVYHVRSHEITLVKSCGIFVRNTYRFFTRSTMSSCVQWMRVKITDKWSLFTPSGMQFTVSPEGIYKEWIKTKTVIYRNRWSTQYKATSLTCEIAKRAASGFEKSYPSSHKGHVIYTSFPKQITGNDTQEIFIEQFPT